MKKFGILLLALVIALGVLGVGYARWSDNVTINGTVSSGFVELGIADLGTIDDGIMDTAFDGDVGELDETGSDPQYYDAQTKVGGINTENKNVASHTSEPVGTSRGKACGIEYSSAVRETITNAYPWYAGATLLKLGNNGSIPVKIEDIRFKNFSDPDHILDFMQVDDWTLTYYLENSIFPVKVNGHGFSGLNTYKNLQIPADTCATLTINFHFIEYIDMNGNQIEDSGDRILPQGKNCTFDVFITASQWNEVN